MLPDWLKQLAAECPEEDRRQLLEKIEGEDMSKADPTISEREMRYRDAQAKRGLKMVRVWVPEDKVEALKDVAREWRVRGMSSS